MQVFELLLLSFLWLVVFVVGWTVVVLVLVILFGSRFDGSCFNACSYSLFCGSVTDMAQKHTHVLHLPLTLLIE